MKMKGTMIVRCLLCDGHRKVTCISADLRETTRRICDACDGLGFQLIERENVVTLVDFINDMKANGEACGLEHFVEQFRSIGPDDHSWLGPDDRA